jgi:hypothetical protein
MLRFSDFHPNPHTYFSFICDNVMDNLSLILADFYEYSDFEFEEREIVKFLCEFRSNQHRSNNDHRPYDKEVLETSKLLNKLMNESKFEEIIQHHHKNKLSDSILYLFPNFDQIVQRGISLTSRDILGFDFVTFNL